MHKSRETLGSIVQLMDEIKNMPVGVGVQGDIQDALNAIDKVSLYVPIPPDHILT